MLPIEDGALDERGALALYRVGTLVTASLDLDETLGAVTAAARELTGAQSTAILLRDDAGDLVIRIGQGAIAAAVGERVRADAGVVGRALRTGRPVLVPDLLNEPGRARPDLDARSGVRAYLAAPLIWRGERLGAVTVAMAEPASLGSAQIRLIAALTQQAASAVAHARDFAAEQARRAELEQLYRALEERTAELGRAQQQLVQNEKMTAVGQLVHGIAHELNTPVGVVISNLAVLDQYATSLGETLLAARRAVEQLRQGLAPSTVASDLAGTLDAADAEYLLTDLPALVGESVGAGERIAAIVRSLGAFVQPNGGPAREIAIADILEAALTLSSNLLKQRAEVVRAFDPVPPVAGHAPELTQAFLHLLVNAAHACDQAPGRIELRVDYDRPLVRVTVSDTGHGIAPEHLSRVFDPFFTTRPPGQGAGLGLAVSHGIINRHGGTITLESARGRGTAVTVRLPAVESRGAVT